MEILWFLSETLRLISYLLLVILGILLIIFICSELKGKSDARRAAEEYADKAKEKLKDIPKEVAEILLSKADDERPIMLNVSQEKLIDKTIEEIEKRNRMRGL